jgi:chemotaxis protein MotA
MDFATFLGLFISLGLVFYAVFLGGNLSGFVDVPAFLIVVLGTTFVTMTSFSITQIGRTGIVIVKAFFHETPSPGEETIRLLRLSQKARQTGLLGIQRDAATERDLFLRQGLVLAVDGMAPDVIERVMRADTAAMLERHASGMAVLRRAGETAPAMGLIGTLIGLVDMMAHLNTPEAIGPAMAVALLGTFYGAVSAYMILMPLATKLERASADELILRKVYTAACLGIARQENPRQLELHLNAILPPSQRVNVFRN